MPVQEDVDRLRDKTGRGVNGRGIAAPGAREFPVARRAGFDAAILVIFSPSGSPSYSATARRIPDEGLSARLKGGRRQRAHGGHVLVAG